MKFQTRLIILFLASALITFALSAVFIGNYMVRSDMNAAIRSAQQTVERLNADLPQQYYGYGY